uniref:Immunoglobulin V-set domain-containing protein n=1 Tax=Oreochromis niloticus TaxID=8128 RepID=A0A669D7T1_ORENI
SFDYISKARTFTVTISDLTSEDAGKYWCGVTRTGQDIYTEVKLKLAPDQIITGKGLQWSLAITWFTFHGLAVSQIFCVQFCMLVFWGDFFTVLRPDRL